MNEQLTNRARAVLALAADQARSFNHEYVGTEHVLLGLIAEHSGTASHVLQSLGIEVNRVRAEIETVVLPGPTPVTMRELPRTPRTTQVLKFALDEAHRVGQKTVDVEHLLIALLREPDGMAGIVLNNLGVEADRLRAEALRTRVELMKIVERAVRPLSSSTPRKRKMREELFAHLTSIYEDELSRSGDSVAAFEAAAQRFGEPAELAREFEASLPVHERVSYWIERLVAYRAPESAARYSLRMACRTFALTAVILAVVMGGVFLRYGWTEDVKTLARVLGAIVMLTPPAQFVIWLAYIKLRNAMWGAFGSRKSLARMLLYDFVVAAVAQLYLISVAGVARLDFGAALEAARLGGVIAGISALAFAVLAYVSGPGEIRDTQWALLELEAA